MKLNLFVTGKAILSTYRKFQGVITEESCYTLCWFFFSLIEILALKAKLYSKTLSPLSGLLIFISCHFSVQFSGLRGFYFVTHCCRKKKKELIYFFMTDIRLFKGETAIWSSRTDVRAEGELRRSCCSWQISFR